MFWLFCLNGHSCNLWSWNKRDLHLLICIYSYPFKNANHVLVNIKRTFDFIWRSCCSQSGSLFFWKVQVRLEEWHSDGPSGTFSHLRTGPLELSSKCPLDYPCLDTNHSLSSGVLLDPMTWFLIWYASNIGCNKKKTCGSQKRNEACQMMTTLLCKLVFQTKYLWNVVKILSLSLSSF